MKNYLPTPCPRDDCGAKTLRQPTRSGTRLYAFCDTCKRKVLYIVYDHEGGGAGYELRIVGAKGSGLVRATFWITRAQKKALEEQPPRMQSHIVRQAIDRELGL